MDSNTDSTLPHRVTFAASYKWGIAFWAKEHIVYVASGECFGVRALPKGAKEPGKLMLNRLLLEAVAIDLATISVLMLAMRCGGGVGAAIGASYVARSILSVLYVVQSMMSMDRDLRKWHGIEHFVVVGTTTSVYCGNVTLFRCLILRMLCAPFPIVLRIGMDPHILRLLNRPGLLYQDLYSASRTFPAEDLERAQRAFTVCNKLLQRSQAAQDTDNHETSQPDGVLCTSTYACQG